MRELSEQEIVRREKLESIREITNPYPDSYDTNYTISEARLLDDGIKDVSIAGRIVFARKMGKLSFLKIRNIEDAIQLELKIDEVGEEAYEFFKKYIDTGDFIGACGEMFTTQTGEKTLRVKTFKFLGKALRPLPEKFHGLTDTEIKYRERYVDLIMNEDSRKIFLGRSKFYAFLREYMARHNFLEVETPIIQTTVSGASAKPFFTHHNALDVDCNLRIAPECYLKECIAAGFDRVFELSKCFRNEGMDPEHLQEFTQVEWYAAYWNYENNIAFYKDFMSSVVKYLTGSTIICYKGNEIDFGAPTWPRINYVEKLNEILGFDFLSIDDVEELKNRIVDKGLFSSDDMIEYRSVAQVIDFVYKKLIRSEIVQPTIIYNYPAVLKPLARKNDDDARIVDVFQVVVCGTELCNAYSELVNPAIQRENFEIQLKQKELGDDETMDLDEDYLLSMETGMPPISGLGFGVDRLMMLIYDALSVRDVVLFPMMKPLNKIVRTSNKTIELKNVVIDPLFEDYVDFETFSKSDFRVVKVLDCKEVPKSNKLLEFTLNDGTGNKRTILSGIRKYYEPEELIGKTLLAITNLPPRTMMGKESCGMLLSAKHEENGLEALNLIMLDDSIPAGAKLY